MCFSLSGKTNTEEICLHREDTISLLQYANENRHSGSFNDVQIIAGNNPIPANKMVLSCFSRFFEKLFKTEMREKYENSFSTKCVDENSMKTLIEFIYTGSIKINADNVCDLLSASDYLIIEDVNLLCFQFLEKALSTDNCFVIMAVADRYQNSILVNYVEQFMMRNLDAVACSEDFKGLAKDELVSFIAHLNRNTTEASSVYSAMMKWVNHDKEIRACYFPDLFTEIKFSNFSSEFLKNVVSKEELVRDNTVCSKLLIDILCNGKQGTKCGNEFQILSLGGFQAQVNEILNLSKEPSRQIPDLPESRYRGCAVNLDDSLYYFGGRSSGTGLLSKSVWRLNLNKIGLEWEQVACMKEMRSYPSCSIFQGTIVVLGGYGSKYRLSSGEFYSPSWNSWNKFPNLNIARSGHALVANENCLFAIGGLTENEISSSVECLKSGNNVWTRANPAQVPKYNFAAVNHKGFIYAFGGETAGGWALKVCEKYDVVEDKWSYISNMKYCRKECCACILKGKVYVVGGLDDSNIAVKEIECYNVLTDEWSVVGRINKELRGHSLVLV